MYPLLSSLSKAYLTIPATSVPSERVFSTAGDILNAQRSQLLPQNVDMQFFFAKKPAGNLIKPMLNVLKQNSIKFFLLVYLNYSTD